MDRDESVLPLEIDVHGVKQLLGSDEDFLLLDCRQPAERDIAKLNAAKAIPMGEIPSRLSEIEAYRQRRIVVHCHLGARSMRVTEWLRAQGFPNVQNMTGGIEAWSLEIDEELPRYS